MTFKSPQIFQLYFSYWIVWRRGEMYRGFWWRNVRVRNHLGDPGVDRRIILRWIFRKWDVGV
jgi:hypothetical protein